MLICISTLPSKYLRNKRNVHRKYSLTIILLYLHILEQRSDLNLHQTTNVLNQNWFMGDKRHKTHAYTCKMSARCCQNLRITFTELLITRGNDRTNFRYAYLVTYELSDWKLSGIDMVDSPVSSEKMKKCEWRSHYRMMKSYLEFKR